VEERLDRWERACFVELVRLRVAAPGDRLSAAAVAERQAQRAGMPLRRVRAAGIVAAELAGTAVRHAGGGVLELSTLWTERVVRVLCTDGGPPILDIPLAFSDGATDTHPLLPEQLPGRLGFGAGLGALLRLAQAVTLSQGPSGKTLVAYLCAAADTSQGRPCPLRVGWSPTPESGYAPQATGWLDCPRRVRVDDPGTEEALRPGGLGNPSL